MLVKMTHDEADLTRRRRRRLAVRNLLRHWVAFATYLVVLATWLSGTLRETPFWTQTSYLAITCLLLPGLYFLSTRKLATRKVVLLRSCGLSLSAITLSGWLVVSRADRAFAPFVAIQASGIIILLLCEVWVSYFLFAQIFREKPDKVTLARESGLPETVVGLMIKEALFWRAVAGATRKLAKRLTQS